PLERALGVLHADPGERIRAVQDEVNLARLHPEVADRLEHEPDVLQARQVSRHHHEELVRVVQDLEVNLVETLVDVDDDVVVERAEVVEDLEHVFFGHQLRGLRGRRCKEQVDPGVVVNQDPLDQIEIDRRGGDDVDDALAVETQVQEDPMVAELEVRIDKDDLPAEFALERDRRVDRERGGTHAALGAVEGEDAAEGRPADQQVARGEAGEQALDPGEQLGRVERLDQVVVGASAEALDLLLDLALD